MAIARIFARLVSEIEEPHRVFAHWLWDGGFWRAVAFLIVIMVVKKIYDHFTFPRLPIG